MRHWKVSLIREGKASREWHLWAGRLSLGSAPGSTIRFPAPFPSRAVVVEADGSWSIDLPDGHHEAGRLSEGAALLHLPGLDCGILVEDDTLAREALWTTARDRIARVEEAASAARDVPISHRLAWAAAACLGIGQLGGFLLVDATPRVIADLEHAREDIEAQEPRDEAAPAPVGRAAAEWHSAALVADPAAIDTAEALRTSRMPSPSIGERREPDFHTGAHPRPERRQRLLIPGSRPREADRSSPPSFSSDKIVATLLPALEFPALVQVACWQPAPAYTPPDPDAPTAYH